LVDREGIFCEVLSVLNEQERASIQAMLAVVDRKVPKEASRPIET
jgi:hypothetical protein